MQTHELKKYSNISYHVVSMPNTWQEKTLLLSKVSEALNPNQEKNHIGAGGTFEDILQVQSNVVFLMSAGFNHYRKNFYSWQHTNFNEGDPVGFVKIRQHLYIDQLSPDHYGYFVQKEKNKPWEILKNVSNPLGYKYILGCTPLLIFNNKPIDLSSIKDTPVVPGEINPPSYLGHKDQMHPRALVGIKENNLVFIVVEHPGCSLKELQELAAKEELRHAINLDGGGSAKFMLKTKNSHWIKTKSLQEDSKRILGHVILVFDSVKT